MLKVFYIIPSLLCVGNTFAQNTPEFSFKLYLEDAVGKKDTVTLGYDPMATDSIGTAFGEKNILNQPWGNNLVGRIGNLVFHNKQWALSNHHFFGRGCTKRGSSKWKGLFAWSETRALPPYDSR